MDQPIYHPDRDGTENTAAAEAGPAVDRQIHARVALQGYARAARYIGPRELGFPHVLSKEVTALIIDLAHVLYLSGCKPQEILLTASNAFAAETGTGSHLVIGSAGVRTAPRLPGPGVAFEVDQRLTHTLFVSEAELNEKAPGWEAFLDDAEENQVVADVLSRIIADRVSDRTVTKREDPEVTDYRRQ